MEPVDMVEQGAEILAKVLEPHGFSYRFLRQGKGSGGYFAVGEFSCGDRSLEFHCRSRLGILQFHSGSKSVSIDAYARHLGKQGLCLFPRGVDSPLDDFRDLANDLQEHFQDFLSGDASELAAAAQEEQEQNSSKAKQNMIVYTGDHRLREEAADHFRSKEWSMVVQKLSKLQYPEDLSPAEKKRLDIAIRRQGSK